ncbi:hypothetical protein KIPE111705_12950 [Kibdelosporangium persicum]|uniref:DUF1579 domain-containing protein n=1 Tax=Kibdelosporangium persicum TaxID=2698649 RepID=A0ABX2F6Y0_9PSEU|nr:hypothetical protein [Kibdelosporangium persicum]NRN67119.1 hypothetical protein [Kibdelosporangium persicum]
MHRRVVVLFAVAGSAFIAATTLTAIVISADVPERAGEAPPPVVDVEAAAGSSADRVTGPPACLIGTWRSVDEYTNFKFYSDQPPMPFTGRGRYLSFRPDGTGSERREGFTLTGHWSGRVLKLVSDGTFDFRWSADAKAITYHGHISTTVTYRYYDHRGLIETQPMRANPNLNEVDGYTCDATRLTETGAPVTGFRSVWVRTGETGVYG